ncbi:MAG TPA: UDP-glucose/GDP-mannose dehydrogenase family protein [Chloroflexota bacterium]|nr:UDP-glucose/GDP-mannose dehydrogenase family protein [Chloroflexota bacterium]
MRRLCVIGTGYVGLVTGTFFAELGNQVACVDVDRAKIELLRSGGMPIYEPGLAELVQRNGAMGRLSFTTSYAEGMREAEFVFIAVNTPPTAESGGADLRYVEAAAKSIGQHLDHDLIIVNKSTVPIGTGDLVARIVERERKTDARFSVVSNPEFLREGSAVADCLNPDRVVLGSGDSAAGEAVAALYLSLRRPIIITDLATAEMIKYASNAMLAARISFINEMAEICEALGADVKQVALGMGYDKRIGESFLEAGLGYGGSCFPKDVKALMHMASTHGCHPQLLQAVEDINSDQRRRAVDKLREELGSLEGKTVAMLGLAFKPNTDDMREAASVDIAHMLQAAGARVKAYDPVAAGVAKGLLPDIEYCHDAYQAAQDSDAVMIVTDWNEFKQLDLPRLKAAMRLPLIVDGRNIYDGAVMRELGFTYRGTGRF